MMVLFLIHSITTTAANQHDITQTDTLHHGEEKRVWANAGYVGVEKREVHAKRLVQAEKIKASVRAKVEHAFLNKMRFPLQHVSLSRLGEKYQ